MTASRRLLFHLGITRWPSDGPRSLRLHIRQHIHPGCHVVFILIDGSLAWFLLRPPTWLVLPYVVLMLQMLNGHGRPAALHRRVIEKPVCARSGLVDVFQKASFRQ
jgi:hypothetical protein